LGIFARQFLPNARERLIKRWTILLSSRVRAEILKKVLTECGCGVIMCTKLQLTQKTGGETMKKFEMPVVVLSEMMMNESIAATCCYSKTTTGLVTTLKVLNGGTIGDSTTYKLKDAVVKALGGLATAPCNHYEFYEYDHTATPPSSAITYDWTATKGPGSNYAYLSGKDVIAFTQDPLGSLGSVTLFASASNTTVYVPSTAVFSFGTNYANSTPPEFSPLAYVAISSSGINCDHISEGKRGSCPFVSVNTDSSQHNGSTVPHTFGGVNWGGAHTAYEFNS
jgi:hypothetical protein